MPWPFGLGRTAETAWISGPLVLHSGAIGAVPRPNMAPGIGRDMGGRGG